MAGGGWALCCGIGGDNRAAAAASMASTAPGTAPGSAPGTAASVTTADGLRGSFLPAPHSDPATEGRLSAEARRNLYFKAILAIETATVRADAYQQSMGTAKTQLRQGALLHGADGAQEPAPAAPPPVDSEEGEALEKLLTDALGFLEEAGVREQELFTMAAEWSDRGGLGGGAPLTTMPPSPRSCPRHPPSWRARTRP